MPDTQTPVGALSDEALARRIADGPAGSTGEEEGELYRRFAPRVRLYGRRHLRNDAAADDLAQEVLLRTIERLHAGEVRSPGDIGSFILGTSRMMAHAERRVAQRREALAAQFIDTAPVTAPASIAGLDAVRVAGCLRALPERDRLVVLLTFYAEREAPRIAEEIGVSPGAVRTIRHRALTRLRHRRCAIMTAPACERLTRDDLIDYTSGDMPAPEAAVLEEHLFACADCGARAAEFDALLRAIRPAMRTAEVGGFMTDAVLNRLAREGVRVRGFTLTPGERVPCAVWEDDELMVLRLRGDFGDATAFTLSQRVAGTEVGRSTAEVAAGSHGEIIYATPAAWVRQLPVIDVECELTAHHGSEERSVGRYTLQHGGVLRR